MKKYNIAWRSTRHKIGAVGKQMWLHKNTQKDSDWTELRDQTLSWTTQCLGPRPQGKSLGSSPTTSAVLASQRASLLQAGCPNTQTLDLISTSPIHSVPDPSPHPTPHFLSGSLGHILQLYKVDQALSASPLNKTAQSLGPRTWGKTLPTPAPQHSLQLY